MDDEARAKIKDAFEADDQAFLSQTENLKQADVIMIGTVIQLYCYADFNARRIVDALRYAASGQPRTASRLQDAQVFPMLEKLVRDHLWESNMKVGLLKAAATVEMHRTHRHNFAHWAARRLRGVNALIMFTKNAREAERRDGAPHGPNEAKFGILVLDDFAGEVAKLQGHANYLAEIAAHIETNIDQIAQEIVRARDENHAPS